MRRHMQGLQERKILGCPEMPRYRVPAARRKRKAAGLARLEVLNDERVGIEVAVVEVPAEEPAFGQRRERDQLTRGE